VQLFFVGNGSAVKDEPGGCRDERRRAGSHAAVNDRRGIRSRNGGQSGVGAVFEGGTQAAFAEIVGWVSSCAPQ